jgi:hypothetical protein
VAVFTCFPLYFPKQLEEGLPPHQPQEVWYMVPTDRAPNRIVDIGGTFETKVQSLLCHQSQMEMLADWFLPDADPTQLTVEEREQLTSGVRNVLRTIAERMGQRYSVDLAEAFYAIQCGPGHFDMAEEMANQMLKDIPRDVEIL